MNEKIPVNEVCRFCGEPIVLNTTTGKWEADNTWLATCYREGEVKEAFLHQPPPPPKDAAESEAPKPKPKPVNQPWIFPWAATHRPPT